MTIFIGSHVNKNKRGWIASLEEITSYGGNAAQIFISSPIGKMSDASIAHLREIAPDIKAYLKKHAMKLFIHSPYTLNFAKDALTEKPYWIDAMITELQLAEEIGAEGCVLHLGKAVSLTQDEAEDNMLKNVCTLMEKSTSNAKLFIETSAAQGTEILATRNTSLDALATFYKKIPEVHTKRISFCVDTCHIWAAGYDISTHEHVRSFFKEWKEKIGMDRLGVIHFNNSVHGLDSRKDRHACIEYGAIPVDGLKAFARETMARYKHIPLILETPSGPQEISVLREIAKTV